MNEQIKIITCIFVSCLLSFLMVLSNPAIAAQDWQRLYPNYPTHGYNDIYAVSSNDVFAVGNNGLIAHYNGSVWSEMDTPVAVTLRSVWGRAANDVFAVGNGGMIIHYNGVRWQKMSSPTRSDLYCVWGFAESGGKVYAGGRNGNILLYSAGNWSYMDTPFADGIWKYSIIYSIWGDSPSNMYAVGWGTDFGSGGSGAFDIFLSNSGGNTWVDQTATYPERTPLLPESIHGIVNGDVYIGGGSGVYRLADGAWSEGQLIVVDDASYNGQSWSWYAWGKSNDSMWFVGNNRLLHYNGDTSQVLTDDEVSLSPYSRTTGISGIDATDFFISGWEGYVLSVRNGAVSSMTAIPSTSVQDMCGNDVNGLYAVGDGGAIFSYDGSSWHPMQSPTNKDLHAVCGTSSSMFAAGADGAVLHYNGSTWSAVASGTTEYLWDVWCLPGDSSALVVGSQGTILECTAQACSSQTTDGTTEDLYAVHHSDLGSFAAGKDGTFMQKDTTNNTWKIVTGTGGDVPSNDIFDLWGDASAGILVAVGDASYTGHSFIHKFTVAGKQWTNEYQGGSSNSQRLRKIAGTEYSTLYVVGNGSDDPNHSNDGIVLYQENGSFTPVKYCSNRELRSAWIVSDTLWVGTSSSTFFNFDGGQWLSTGGTPSIQAIGGSGVNNLFAVGDQGLIMRYNGISWTGMDSGTVNDYFGSVYVAPDGAWALAGSDSKIFRYDGSEWSTVTAAVIGAGWSDFWGFGDRVFAAGNGGILASTNSGQSWQSQLIPDSSSSMSSVWGAGYNGPFFASGHFWDGSRYHTVMLTKQSNGNWTAMQANGIDYAWLGDIWGNAADNVYVVGETSAMLGENETEILHFNGSSWQQVFYRHNVEPAQSLTALIGTSKDDVFAFGSTAYSKDQCSSTWKAMQVPGIPTLKNVWGFEGTDGYYYLFGVGVNQMGIGDSVYQYKFPINKKCSSPWSLFLPAILSNHQ